MERKWVKVDRKWRKMRGNAEKGGECRKMWW